MSAISLHDDWLSLIEISGPFLAVPVLKEAFPQGLEELDGIKRKRLRQAYQEWREALELEDAQFAELHAAWIDEVLSRGLEFDEDGKGDVLKRADWCTAKLRASLPEHGVTQSPDLAVIDEQRANKPLLLIQTYAQDVDLDATLKQNGWVATPADRMVALCRSLGCRLGLVTNGERWMLVDAPVGAVTTFASWYARIWSQEPITLQAFVHLLGIRRFFVDETEQLPALFDRSLKFQDEVTDALGEQVRRAVEVLIQTLDKADQDRNRELLHDVKEPELYEAALTVMMRLVFLLSAEERGLLLMGDERYEANYALSTLRMQLRKESEEILERRWDAWSRLLAIFRAVFGGIEHENLRLPALGGSLFDPDRFPFLEGRAKGSTWRSDAAKPLPIDNRTVLLLLEAIQQFQGRTLSYRALDVEQIGYVYEGLLERTVKRTDEVTLELDATKSAKTPWVKLAELDSAQLDGATRLAELLQERSGSSASRVRNDLAKPVDDTLADRLLTACLGDTKLRDRVKPYTHLLRTDPWGYPLVYPAGAFIVTTGSDRRETGTHYTPKSLTEAIVAETLTPVAYIGPAEGTPREHWTLKSPAEILDLKICDPAMGSGAFLVQACRWLSDRLVEAWSQVEATGKTVSVDGDVLDAVAAKEPLPRDSETRTVIARRLIAERCLYGVDLNPLAVELAKLSIWLVTLAKGRPFGFLDHNLRCGDSLLGIQRLDQLIELSMTPTGKGQQRLFGQNIEQAVHEAIELRKRLRDMPIRDIHDVDTMTRLDADARQKLEVPQRIADAFIGELLKSGGSAGAFGNAVASLAIQAGQAIASDKDAMHAIARRTSELLRFDLPSGRSYHRPFHWPLEFPEVFESVRFGFDALIGNPPFIGGTLISGRLGKASLRFLQHTFLNGVTSGGRGDLCAYFFLQANKLVRTDGCFGLIATNTIGEGDTKEIGLDQIVANGGIIYRAISSMKWPGQANLEVSLVWVKSGSWLGPCTLDGKVVPSIPSSLSAEVFAQREIKPLTENVGRACEGVKTLGMGFVLETEEAQVLLDKDSKNRNVIFPFSNGDDITSRPDQSASRWVINFFDFNDQEARKYSDCWQLIEERVKQERQRKKPDGSFQLRAPLPQKYWLYGDSRRRFITSCSDLKQIIVAVQTSKYVAPCFQKNDRVFSQALVMIASDDSAMLAVLNSSLHREWIAATCSSLETRLRYLVSDGFNTFPFPELTEECRNEGARLHRERSAYLIDNSVGLTEAYNRLNDENWSDPEIVELRKILVKIDQAVLNAYGWGDIELDHAFREVPYLPENDRIRFTISEFARVEVLRRLAELNRQRHEEEVELGLRSEANPRKPKGTPLRQSVPTKGAGSTAQSGFDFGISTIHQEKSSPTPSIGNQWGDKSSDQILAWLEAHTGWFAKQAILVGCGAAADDWNEAIAELLRDEFIETHADGSRWRAKP